MAAVLVELMSLTPQRLHLLLATLTILRRGRALWLSVTNPNEIAKVVCQINAAQYHQAHDTPFGSGPLADMIGRQGDTVISADLLQGKLPTSLPSDLLPETLHVLQSLATPASTTDISPIITDEEFVQTYRVAQENTSSSPSGRHIGH